MHFLTSGIVSAFQVNLRDAHRANTYEVQEHDDSGIFRTKYNVLSLSDTHAHLHRTWTNFDYQQFANGAPPRGEHKVQSQHSVHVHLKDGKVDKVHRTTSAFFRPAKGHPRAENFKAFEKQDIEMSTGGYSKLTLRSCHGPERQRSKRSTAEYEHLKTTESLTRDSLMLDDTDKIKVSEVSKEKKKTRPLYEVLRCFVDDNVEEREVGYCTNELHNMVRNDKNVFRAVKRLVQNRNHQNVTSWAVYLAALAAHGKYEAQNTLAYAVKTDNPRPLTSEEYETLLISIFYLPDGPLHSSLFNALFDLTMEDSKGEAVTATAMLVLSGLTERAKRAGYNETLSDSVAEMIHNRYQNKSSIYHPESMEYESHLRDHIWAFGNLGHHSGLPVILEHVEHDNSDIRSAVISAMRKMSPKNTDRHLMTALNQDEHKEVKTAVVNVFIDRHQNLTETVVLGLEQAMWHADKDDSLDSAIQEFLQNHGNHSRAIDLRTKRRVIHRRKRALIPELRPRSYEIGRVKRWDKVVGGNWLGAETVIQFLNKLELRVGIFGGKFEINLDNYALIRGHILRIPFDVAKGKAAFKVSASFKNDIPKDLIHTVADIGDELLRNFDSIASVITKEIEKFRAKLARYIPLNIDKFTDFARKINNFLKELTLPLQAIKATRKIIGFSRDLSFRANNWTSLIIRIKKLQHSLTKLNGLETMFKKVLHSLDKILGIIDDVTKKLPNNLPDDFNIKSFLHNLRKVPVSQQDAEIKQYFKTLGSSVPDGFRLQLPFKFSIHFSFSLKRFQQVLLRLQRFSIKYLEMSNSLDSLDGTKLPTMSLPFLKVHYPVYQSRKFNFGLDFDWKVYLRFDLNLKSKDFQTFLALLGKFGEFFRQFTLLDFDLDKFFQDISPGRSFDLQTHFPGMYKNDLGNSSDPSDLLQAFLLKITDVLDLHIPNISAISHLTDFFHELGPAMTQFAEQSAQKTCRIHETAVNVSQSFEDFKDTIEKEGIFLLKGIQNSTQSVLQELLNLTVILDTSIDEIEQNFTTSVKHFVSDSLKETTDKLSNIENIVDGVMTFSRGTSSEFSGACIKASTLSANVIDQVQNNARLAVNDFAAVIGPVALNIKTVGTDLKSAVTNVETWYEENLAARVGKISRVSQIIGNFLSIVNTKNDFLNALRDIASRLYEVLKHLKTLPEYAIKARKTADEIIDFANEAQNYKDEIQKLDIRKQFGNDFDQRLQNVCNKFKAITAAVLVRPSDVVQEFNTFFNKEVKTLVEKALPKFRSIKDSVDETREELQGFKSMVDDVIAVLHDLKPVTSAFSTILATARKLPDCEQMTQTFVQSTKPCVLKALSLGRFVFHQYEDVKKEIAVLNKLVPETWKNFKSQKCVKGGTCISKAFIEQGKAIKKKLDIVKDKLEKASEYTDLLRKCEEGASNITEVVDSIKLLMEQVRNFSLQDNTQRVKALLQKITGQTADDEDQQKGTGSRKRSIKYANDRLERAMDYIQKAKDLDYRIQNFQENTFRGFRSVYEDAIHKHVQSLRSLRSKLELSYQLWKKTKDVNSVMEALDTSTKRALAFADNLQEVTALFSKPTGILLDDTEEVSDKVKPHLDKYTSEVTDAVDKVNGFLQKVTNFLNTIQTRQRGLDPSTYKPWQDIPYCSKEVCLRSIRRSSPQYLSDIFTWKFPHLDDLSSMEKSGRWLTPGLFDDYKVEGIAQFSAKEMILGMHGVASNEDKASLLVVTNVDRGVKKIVQLKKHGVSLSVKIGGVAIAGDYIWISNNDRNEILSVKKSDITFSSPKPSQIDIFKTVTVEGTAGSVSYDEQRNVLWITNGKVGKAYGYRLSRDGDLPIAGLAPYRVIHIGKNAQGMTIVRQFGDDYACISRCAMVSGFQCKLEFHHLNNGDETGENTIARVVRTPSGLEAVNRVDNEVILLAFSSGTFAEKENFELLGGDFEDRYFKIRIPILNTTFGIKENCIYFKIRNDDVVRPRRLFPTGDRMCGTKRKRSISQELQETDVYYEQLEKIHEKRVRRSATGLGSCEFSHRGTLLRGSREFYRYTTGFPVFGIYVKFVSGAAGHYTIDYQAKLCLQKNLFTSGLIPGAWISVYASASVPLYVIEAGVTIEARLLEIYLVPELRISFGSWPLKACIELRIRLTPLSIRVYLWYRFMKISIDCWLIGCDIEFYWGSMNTFEEWSWSTKQIDRVLFTNCKEEKDSTPPETGTCVARQVADTKYFVEWHGFKEDSKIGAYQVRIGSIEGSGDDYSSWVGTSLSKVVTNLNVMDGREVFVSIMATNDVGLDSPLANCPPFPSRRKGPQIRYVYDGVVKEKDADYQSDNYTLGMNFAFKSDSNEIVQIKWGVSSSPSCTFDTLETDVVPLKSLGDSNSIQVSGLNLEHGKTYFTRLYAMNKFGLKAVMCSDGILIDITQPIPKSFQDGAGDVDANFLPSLRRVRAKFDHFVDRESPITKYEWKIVRNISGEEVTAFVNVPLTQTTPLMDGLSLKAGSAYRITLRGTNAAGLQAVIETNGFIPDNTPPYCEGRVIDVSDEKDTSDVDFVRELKSIQAKWKCSDRESTIRSQLVGVGTYPGGDDIRAFEKLDLLPQTTRDGVFYVQLPNITILVKVRYHVTIKIINGAGLKKTISSDGILIDITPPTVAPLYIKDGKREMDKNYTSERFSYSAHWEQAFSDAESGLAEYRVGLGTKPGLADIQALSSVGAQTNETITGILLESGRRYFVTVIGCNTVGMCINASSDGAIVDFVPPHSGNVFTGLTGPPVLYQWITTSVWARWNWCLADEKRASAVLKYNNQCGNDSFFDVHSGIGMFSISVISQTTEQLLAPFKFAGRQRYAGRNINLKDGVYSVAIEASDKAGVASRGLSNTFIVDSSPPLIPLVQHGHFGEALAYVNASVVTFRSYFMVEDELSRVKAYKIGVGSYSGGDDIIKFQSFSLRFPTSSLRANWTSLTPTFLKNNRRYFITVVALNSAGLSTVKSSPPLVSDLEAPKGGIILDGWDLQDVRYQSFASVYRAHWYGFTDFSGIDKVYLGLSSKSKSAFCDVRKEVIVSSDTNFHVLSGLALISGQTYYGCLKLEDRAGNSNFFHSNGVLVDTSPPRPGYVSNGRPGQEIDVQMESSVLTASWGNFTEHETSIVSYHLAFGSFPGGQDVQGFTNVGMVNTATSSKLKVSELKAGQVYYASVIAYNILGMPSFMVTSVGVLVDFIPPFFSLPVRDGGDSGKELSYTLENSLKATWKCEDPESGLSAIAIAFGLQPGDADIVNFTNLPVSQTSFITNPKLRLGARYFGTVRCTNKAGHTTVSFSDGIVYDDTPPNPTYVRDGDYQIANRTLFVTFKFVDVESGIQAYRLKVWGTSSLNTSMDMHDFFGVRGNVTSLNLELSKELASGKTYYVNVTAVNSVGLEATIQSDGFAVDTTPPICSQVWDGRSNYPDDTDYAPSSNRFIISWVCYDNESPIVRYQFSVRDVQTREYAIPFYTLKTHVNSTGSAVITGGGRMIASFIEGHTYQSGVEVANAVGLKTIKWTDGVTIDNTPPEVSNLKLAFDPEWDFLKVEWSVSDRESGLKSVSWGLGTTPGANDIKNFSDVSPSVTNASISSVSFQQGSTCILNIFVVNKGGLSSKSSSNAIIIDRSTPSPGIVAAHHVFPRSFDQSSNKLFNSSFVVTWTGFTDPESGIKKTSWAIGTDCQKLKQDGDDLYTEVVADESVGGVIIENQTLMENETYFVSVRVTNGAGLHRTDCSPGMLVILGKLSAGVVSDGPLPSANDIDFQLDDRAIWAHWRGFKDPAFGISRYDWCIRDLPPNASGLEACIWPFMEVHHLKTKAKRLHNLTLSHGKKYYVTVKAENARGDTVMSSSDGVIIDRTPPVAKSIQISPSSGKGTLFLTSPSAPVVTWSIDDPESGISHFIVHVGSLQFKSDLLASQRLESLSRSLNLGKVNFTLYQGLIFYVTVTGVNMVGLESVLTSQQVVVDWTPPEAGEIVDGNQTMLMPGVFIDSDYQKDSGMLFAHWSGFKDSESDVIEYQWCIGITQGNYAFSLVLVFF